MQFVASSILPSRSDPPVLLSARWACKNGSRHVLADKRSVRVWAHGNREPRELRTFACSGYWGQREGFCIAKMQKAPKYGAFCLYMAEEVRFELTEEFPLRRFSRPLHSTALPLLRRERAP